MRKRRILIDAARRWPREASGETRSASKVRERRLLVLGYRAQAIGYQKAHLGDAWVRHFVTKAERLLALANDEWVRHG